MFFLSETKTMSMKSVNTIIKITFIVILALICSTTNAQDDYEPDIDEQSTTISSDSTETGTTADTATTRTSTQPSTSTTVTSTQQSTSTTTTSIRVNTTTSSLITSTRVINSTMMLNTTKTNDGIVVYRGSLFLAILCFMIVL